MNKTSITLIAVSMIVFGTPTQSHEVRFEGYGVNANGELIRSGTGNCWRTGTWTKQMAVAECEPDMKAPAPAKPAPVVMAKPVPAPAPYVAPPKPPAPPPPPPVIVQKAPEVVVPPPPKKARIALAGKASFAVGKAVLAPAGKAQIDNEVLLPLAKFSAIESITITGHSDPMGNEARNVELSKARADAVKAYLVSRGVTAEINTVGKGSSTPIPEVKCNTRLSKAQLSACYEPLRRIEIDVAGEAM